MLFDILNHGDESMLKNIKQYWSRQKQKYQKKKSRFIATVRPVKTEEQARAFIEEMKKKILGCNAQCVCISNWRTK